MKIYKFNLITGYAYEQFHLGYVLQVTNLSEFALIRIKSNYPHSVMRKMWFAVYKKVP